MLPPDILEQIPREIIDELAPESRDQAIQCPLSAVCSTIMSEIGPTRLITNRLGCRLLCGYTLLTGQRSETCFRAYIVKACAGYSAFDREAGTISDGSCTRVIMKQGEWSRAHSPDCLMLPLPNDDGGSIDVIVATVYTNKQYLVQDSVRSSMTPFNSSYFAILLLTK